jgi:hypothetical protein
MSIPISPETKVGDLLDAYPGIEETLIRIAPAFEKLRNPVLRKTVAKVATLQQAAKIGGVPLPQLIGQLREAVGQGCAGPGAQGAEEQGDDSSWLKTAVIIEEIDADAMLETGVHPIGKVRECTAKLNGGEAVLLKSSFRPEPLIDLMRQSGMAVYSEETSPGRHSTYFGRKPG